MRPRHPIHIRFNLHTLALVRHLENISERGILAVRDGREGTATRVLGGKNG